MHKTIDQIMACMEYKQGLKIHYEVQFDNVCTIPQNSLCRKIGYMMGVAPYNSTFWPNIMLFYVVFCTNLHLPCYNNLQAESNSVAIAKCQHSFVLIHTILFILPILSEPSISSSIHLIIQTHGFVFNVSTF